MDRSPSFFLAEAGASAALTGLIFVGVSINLDKIIAGPGLPGRAFEALLMLVSVLMVSSLMLVPEQPSRLAGLEIVGVGLLAWALAGTMQFSIWRQIAAEYHPRLLQQVTADQSALLLVVVAGILVALLGPAWLHLLVPGLLLCILGALLDAWVLLIEINR